MKRGRGHRAGSGDGKRVRASREAGWACTSIGM